MLRSLDRLGIIILNYNSSALTINNTKNLIKLNSGAKIIVVDNHSTDNSSEILKEELDGIESVHLVFSNSNKGYASGNNIGIHYAENIGMDTVLIMNPDIEVPDVNILFQMYDILEKNRSIGAITVKTIFNGNIREPNECAWSFMTPSYMMFGGTILGGRFVKPLFLPIEKCTSKIINVDVVQGCFFMIRSENIRDAGYLDEHTFLYTEESILAKRLKKVNKKNAVITDMYINHNHEEKAKRMYKYNNKVFDMKCYYESRKYYIKKYSQKGKCFYIIASLILNLDHFVKKTVIRLLTK